MIINRPAIPHLRMQQPMLVTAAREKLAYWKLTPEQIAAIEKSGKPSSTVAIKANVSGVVMTKRVNTGDYVSQGGVLFDIANLSKVWALFDAYEADLPFIKKGDRFLLHYRLYRDEHLRVLLHLLIR